MDNTITQIILDVTMAVFSAAMAMIAWWLKRRLTLAQRESMLDHIQAAVRAAEIIGASFGWSGSEKKDYVVSIISDRFKLDPDQIDMFIEAAVAELKFAGEELIRVDTAEGERVLSTFSAPFVEKAE